MEVTPSFIESLLPQLGTSAVFLFAAWRFYTDSNTKIKEKDEYIKNLTASLQELYIRNTELLTQLKDSINVNTKSIEANTQALKSLENKV